MTWALFPRSASFGPRLRGRCEFLGQTADQRAAHQPRQRFDGEISGVVFDSAGWPLLRGNMANERGMLVGKQLEARRMMRQPADIFGGTAHQAVWLADEVPMQAAAQ